MTSSEFREDLDIHKTRMNGLSCGEESMTIAVLIQCQRVTDGRTDRRMSSHNVDSRKNQFTFDKVMLEKKGTVFFDSQCILDCKKHRAPTTKYLLTY